MVLISVDRYMAICDPLRYSVKVTQQIVALCVFLCWVCSVFYAVILLYDSLNHPGRYNSCIGECVVSITGAVDIVVGFIIPITVIVVLYMRVFAVAMSQARAIKSNISLERLKTVKVKRSEIKAARTLGILVVVFLICYCPYYCVALTGHAIMVGTSADVSMILLMYFNSCLNPVIYAIFYPWFKKAIRLIVTFQIIHPSSHDANIL
ncbi:Trace amine-associated receptor 4 [Collichthys lucidus]|uniref:Trace amine-associated receptor 4 n=1 Tax=Collichthys lucidus TaxID=240159 RepID=A0A4U5U1V4_COLLU|nr:Trace amine-associated receptor 4 [Collichthys lucidus]